MLKKMIAFSVLGMTVSTLSMATAPEAVKAEQRQEAQTQKVEQKAAEGKLTAEEKAKLDKKQAGIEEEKAQAEANGKVSQGEKAKLDRMQDRQEARIDAKAAKGEDKAAK